MDYLAIIFVDLARERGRREIQIRMIYSFRPLPLVKGHGWLTYHLTVHTLIIPMSKKTIKLMTTRERERERRQFISIDLWPQEERKRERERLNLHSSRAKVQKKRKVVWVCECSC